MVAESNGLVQVVCALPDEQPIVEVPFEAGLTAQAAVDRSGLVERYATELGSDIALGVWAVEVDPGFLLEPGDRVEISRPLRADPRVMRREMLSDGRVMGGAGVRKKESA